MRLFKRPKEDGTEPSSGRRRRVYVSSSYRECEKEDKKGKTCRRRPWPRAAPHPLKDERTHTTASRPPQHRSTGASNIPCLRGLSGVWDISVECTSRVSRPSRPTGAVPTLSPPLRRRPPPKGRTTRFAYSLRLKARKQRFIHVVSHGADIGGERLEIVSSLCINAATAGESVDRPPPPPPPLDSPPRTSPPPPQLYVRTTQRLRRLKRRQRVSVRVHSPRFKFLGSEHKRDASR